MIDFFDSVVRCSTARKLDCMHLKSCSAAQTLVGSTHGSYTAWLNMSMKKCGTYRFRLGAVIHLMHAQARGQIHRVRFPLAHWPNSWSAWSRKWLRGPWIHQTNFSEPKHEHLITADQAPKMCLLSKSQFWSNATKNVKNQLPIGFGPGDFSRD